MQKLKLLPSLKEKKRYIVYHVISDSDISHPDQAILAYLKDMLGVFESAKAGIQSLHYNTNTKKGVIRVGVAHTDKAKASLALLTHLQKKKAIIHTVYTSGLLNKAKTKANQG